MPSAGIGIIASSVVTSVCTSVLNEPFNNLTAWSTLGPPTIVTGRTGTALSCVGATQHADYLMGASENDYVTVGFAWRTNTTNVAQRGCIELWSDNNTNPQVRILYNGTTAQTFTAYLGAGTGSPMGTTSGVSVAVNTWVYIEVQSRFHDTLGTVVMRINGTTVLNLTNVDTRTTTGGTENVYDAIRLGTLVSGLTSLWDDLYLTVGSGCLFQGDHTIP